MLSVSLHIWWVLLSYNFVLKNKKEEKSCGGQFWKFSCFLHKKTSMNKFLFHSSMNEEWAGVLLWSTVLCKHFACPTPLVHLVDSLFIYIKLIMIPLALVGCDQQAQTVNTWYESNLGESLLLILSPLWNASPIQNKCLRYI